LRFGHPAFHFGMPRTTQEPRVALLIAMRNEAAHIERCLASVFAQDYPAQHLEVWVLDGRSTDESCAIVARLFSGRSRCHLIENPGVIQSTGWNLGIERCSADVIGIVSAHAELDPTYVSMAVETLERTGADLVGGPMRAVGIGRVGRAVALATSAPFGVGGARFHYTSREESVDTVYQGLCRRRTYAWVGGFDATMVRNQDDELSYRLLDRGGRIVCNPAIRSRYFNRATLRSLWHQYWQYGFWKVRVLQRHPRQFRLRHLIPAAFVTALALGSVSAVVPGGGTVLLLVVAGAYASANLLASVLTARREAWDTLPLLPVVFATLHLSYGVGFLSGLWSALVRGTRSGRAPGAEVAR
jgi:succinoglycan biosynthesis protein ExoA